MNNFIVSARKYRPSTFKTVVGQDYIVTTLKNAIKGDQLAQAFLFTGPRGVGKTTCARILAKTINCTNVNADTEACNECESCRSFNESASFNVHELDAASNNSVEDIRTLVDQVRIPPQTGKYKIYIIDEVHMLSTAAFNAFLKTLEEPPAYAKFILATTEKHKIIPTILSRCQVFDFKRIKVEDIAKHLDFVAKSESITAEPEALHVIASKSDGALRDALSIFDQMVSFGSNHITAKDVIENLNILDHVYHFRIVDAALNGDITECLLILNEIYDKGFDGQAVITGLSDHLRSLLVCKDVQTLPLLEVHENVAEDYKRQSISSSVRFLIQALEIMNQCDVTYKASSSKRFQIELAILKISQLSSQSKAQPSSNEISPMVPEQKKETPVAPVQPKKSEPENRPEPSNVKSEHSSSVSEERITDYQESAPKKAIPNKVVFDEMSVRGTLKHLEKNDVSEQSMEQEFSDDDFEQAFKTFKEKLSQDEEKSYEFSVIDRISIKKMKDLQYQIMLDSSLETETIKALDIQTYLRTNLHNKHIHLELIWDTSIERPRIETREEQLKDFISSNPEVQTLMKELDMFPDV